MKTLGQIAFERFEEMFSPDLRQQWDGSPRWEAAAQAVRQAVLEEAAQFMDERATENHRTPADTFCYRLAATWLRNDIKDQK